MESMKETRKWKCEDEQKEQNSRRSSSQILFFLNEKIELDREIKKELGSKDNDQQEFQQTMHQQQQNNNMMHKLNISLITFVL